MASARSAWGIDLGNRALKAVKLVRDGDRYRIDDFEILEHEQVLSVAGDNKESLLKTALANFTQRHQTRGSLVGVSVSGQSSFARFIKLPPVETKKIPEIVKFEAIQQIPFPLDNVEWSFQLFHEKDSPDIEVGIFAMRKELVNRHIGFFTDLGLNVQVVQMSPLAVYNAMWHDDQVHQTTMFMDCGSENTDLIIADGQTVWLRTIPIGGNNFTDTLAKAFKLNFAKAEELKRNAATSKYAKQIFQAMRPVFADLVADIQRSIGFYASVHREARIGRIVALGSTFQLPGLQKYLQQNLQLTVEKLDGFKALPPSDTKLAAELAENSLSLAGAYGLALQVMGDSKISSSLLPEKIRRIKMWQEKMPKFAAAATLFVAGTLGAGASYYYNDLMYKQADAARKNYAQVLRDAKKNVTDWRNDVESQGEQERKSVNSIRSLQAYRQAWQEILTTVFASVPETHPEALKAKPRAERDQIDIDAVLSQYWNDLKAPLEAKDYVKYIVADVKLAGDGAGGMGRFGGMTPMPDPTNPTANQPGPRGFVVTIRGTTPHKNGGSYVEGIIGKTLLALTSEKQFADGKSWYVARAELVRAGPRAVRQTGAPGIGGAPSGFGGGMGGGMGGSMLSAGGPGAEPIDADMLGGEESQGQVNQIVAPIIDPNNPNAVKLPPDPLADPYFKDEFIDKDTDFTLLVVIALDPQPAPKKAE